MNTNQFSELDRIKLKIKALAAKTVDRGASEAEALAAMNVVGRLLTQYNLTMNELDVRDAGFTTIYLELGRERRHAIDYAVPGIAALTGTKTWFHRRWGTKDGSAYAFFGQEQDLAMAEYLYRVIMSAMESEVAVYKTGEHYRELPKGSMRKTAYLCFLRGMANRLALRLRQMKLEQDAELARRRSSGTALVVLKDQLINAAFKKDGPKLASVKIGYKIGDYRAFGFGNIAGERVNLSRPLKAAGSPKGLLK
jgi:hypothetical protein